MSQLNAFNGRSIGASRLPRFADGIGRGVIHAAAVFRGDALSVTMQWTSWWPATVRGSASSSTADGAGLFATFAPLGAAAHPPAFVAPTPLT
jgi:hypothetical protein